MIAERKNNIQLVVLSAYLSYLRILGLVMLSMLVYAALILKIEESSKIELLLSSMYLLFVGISLGLPVSILYALEREVFNFSCCRAFKNIKR